MCEVREKCVNVHKEYSDVLQVPDSGNILEEFIIRDIAKNLVIATEVNGIFLQKSNSMMRYLPVGICSIGNSS